MTFLREYDNATIMGNLGYDEIISQQGDYAELLICI